MGYTPGFSEQNGVNCFSQRGEVLYCTPPKQLENAFFLRFHVMCTVSRYHPKTVFVFFRAWGLGQQGKGIQINRKFYRPPHFVNNPSG